MAHKAPNILWIGLDQIRFDTPGVNGNTLCRTPHIDRLAGEGVNFTRAYTTCSLCSPARASMFTGKYAFRHGMGTNCDMYHSLSAELTHPEDLLHLNFQNAGYSAGYAGKWHVGTNLGPADFGYEGMSLPGYGNIVNQGIFKNYLQKNGLHYTIDSKLYVNPNEQTLAGGRWNGPVESAPAHYVANYTMEQMDLFADRDQPFFMNCQFWGPHGPHLPCDGFYGMHDRDSIPPWANWDDDLTAKPGRIERESNDFYRNHPRTWEECRELVGLYYDTTAMIDHQIGRLLDYLADRGLRENTIVVLSADHGDMTGSHGGQLDKGMLYQEAQHIPMILSWPGKIAAAANDTLALNMDIMPTLMDFAGISVPDGLDGISLKPAVSDSMNYTGRKEVYLEFHGLRFLYSQRAIITDDNWKYIFTPGDRDELYDLNSDSAEMHNLIDSQEWSSKRQELQERIRVTSAGFKDPLRDCISKFFGIWNTESGQIDATKFF
ncbi:MAG: sulfatase-like hydrolase/transferase [Spirochaetia bacterium]|nr:sulfatase-like hydrolase/transferase [Spirochaetia bacterium]